jgi:hypothetical protein
MASKNSPFAYLAEQATEVAPTRVREFNGLTVQQLIETLQQMIQKNPDIASYEACVLHGQWCGITGIAYVDHKNTAILFKD